MVLTVRHVPVPHVLPDERLLIKRLRFDAMYHVVSRYGYMDAVDLGKDFIDVMLEVGAFRQRSTLVIACARC